MKKKIVIIAIIAVVVIAVAAAVIVSVMSKGTEDLLKVATYTTEDGEISVTVEKDGDGYRLVSEDERFSGELEFVKKSKEYIYESEEKKFDIYIFENEDGKQEVWTYLTEGKEFIMFWDPVFEFVLDK